MAGRTWTLLLVIALICGLNLVTCALGSASNSLKAEVQLDGSFELIVNGEKWMSGSEAALQSAGSWRSNTAGSLKQLGKAQVYEGVDTTGSFNATQVTWAVGASGKTWITTIRAYSNVNAVVFQQQFPDGLQDTSVWDTDKVMSSFPTINLEGENDGKFGYTSWWNQFIESTHSGQWWSGMSWQCIVL